MQACFLPQSAADFVLEENMSDRNQEFLGVKDLPESKVPIPTRAGKFPCQNLGLWRGLGGLPRGGDGRLLPVVGIVVGIDLLQLCQLLSHFAAGRK